MAAAANLVGLLCILAVFAILYFLVRGWSSPTTGEAQPLLSRSEGAAQPVDDKVLIVSPAVLAGELKKLKQLRRGYYSLLGFLVLTVLFIWCVVEQRDSQPLNAVNTVMQGTLDSTGFIGLAKTPKKFMKWASGPFLDFLYSERFQKNTTLSNGQEIPLKGVIVADFNYLLGGVVIIQRRGGDASCEASVMWSNRYLNCYSDDVATKQWVPKGLDRATFIYNDDFDGYFETLPTSSSKREVRAVLHRLGTSAFLDHKTRELELRFTTYNANLNVLTTSVLSATFPLAGTRAKPSVTVTSIPNSINLATSTVWAQIAQLVFLGYWATMVFFTLQKGPCPSVFGPPLVKDGQEARALGYIIHTLILVLFLVWSVLLWTYDTAWDFTESEKTLSQVFAGRAEVAQDHDADDAFVALFNTLWIQVDQCRILFRVHFTIAGFVAFLLVFRLFEHLEFQKRLNAFTVTLRAVLPDLLHFTLVLGAAIVTMGFAGYLIYGAYWFEFKTLPQSIMNTFWIAMKIWKPRQKALAALPNVEMGTIFLLVLQIVVVLLILKMVLAIIFVEYKESRKESRRKATPPGLHHDLPFLYHHADVKDDDADDTLARIEAAGLHDGEQPPMGREELEQLVGHRAGLWLRKFGVAQSEA